MAIQIFVRLIDGHTRCLSFPSSPSSPSISGETLKRRLSDLTGIPASSQRLVSGTLDIRDETLVPPPDASGFPPTLHLLLRLPGGKGGFGSLLRGAATKAGQKKTNNFDACRDMSGRRLRHVNAEKRLEEWRAEAEERKLERIAEEFLKRKAKEVRKGAAKGPTEKYVEKYREESERCAGEVEEAVRESFRLYEEQKRKALPASGSASKRLKLWFGKQKLEESDSEEEDEDDEDNDRKSVVTDGEGTSGSGPEGPNSWPKEQILNESENNKDNDSDEGNGKSVLNDSGKSGVQSNERDGSLGLVSECNLGGDSSCEGSSQSNLDDECGSSKDSVNGVVDAEVDGSIGVELSVHSETVVEQNVHFSDPVQSLDPADNGAAGSHSNAPEPKTCLEVTEGASVPDVEKPLNFNNYDSVAELEVLGMERLKMELQTRGLKCGGTLHERAERLFLLKTTPIHMLPKKILAKPRS